MVVAVVAGRSVAAGVAAAEAVVEPADVGVGKLAVAVPVQALATRASATVTSLRRPLSASAFAPEARFGPGVVRSA